MTASCQPSVRSALSLTGVDKKVYLHSEVSGTKKKKKRVTIAR